MYWSETGSGFDFNNQLVFDEEVKAPLSDNDIFITDLNRILANMRNIIQSQFTAQGMFIERLEEAGSERSMHLDRASDDASGQIVNLLVRLPDHTNMTNGKNHSGFHPNQNFFCPINQIGALGPLGLLASLFGAPGLLGFLASLFGALGPLGFLASKSSWQMN